MIFVDANVPMYLVGRPHPHKLDAQVTVERLIAGREGMVTSSEVLQEIIHRYVSVDRRDRIAVAFDVLQEVVDDVFAVEKDDVLMAKDLVSSHPRLSARDAVHVAVMRRRKIARILSFDIGFDDVAGIRRLPVS
ncbi:MAG TPA: type II toxin-antitoxin system VapC family toxin [Solirubrobacteraceae bacterium]|nr:type II toxin-antitoxin system VapC family toxin [Solirubrobacteraceae bacterium]